MAFIQPGQDRDEVTQTAYRRFGKRIVVGTAPELVDHFGSLAERDVERLYVWFTDFAPTSTVSAFGETVISQFA